MKKRLSPVGYQLIRESETLTLTPRGDYGHMEIGWGHDILPNETFPNPITPSIAEHVLSVDITICEADVNRNGPDYSNQDQFDALVDFRYECGEQALVTLLSHGWHNVPYELAHWVYAHSNGKVVKLPGMVTRRNREIALFMGYTLPLCDECKLPISEHDNNLTCPIQPRSALGTMEDMSPSR